MSDFADYLPELFRLFGPVTVSRMFGGHGVYHDGLMFGLVHEDALYLKTDAQIVGHFEKLKLEPFAFRKGGKTIKTSYYLAPADILEDSEQAAAWARRSFEVALRARKAKPQKKPKAKRPSRG